MWDTIKGFHQMCNETSNEFMNLWPKSGPFGYTLRMGGKIGGYICVATLTTIALVSLDLSRLMGKENKS